MALSSLQITLPATLDSPFESLTRLCAKHVLPYLSTRKGQVAAISSAVALTVLYLAFDRITRPPRALRYIPHVSYFSFISDMVKRKPFSQIADRNAIPIIKQGHDIYLRLDRPGWTVFVANPLAAKRILLKLDLFTKVDLNPGREGTLFNRLVIGRNLVFVSDIPEWRKQRKILNPAFHRSMPVQLFGRMTQKLFAVIDSPSESVTVDWGNLMTRWALDIIGLAGFEFDFNSLADPEGVWPKYYHSVFEGVKDPVFMFFPWLERKLLFLFPERRRLHQVLDKFLVMLDEVIANKRAILKERTGNVNLNDNEKDLLTLMIESEMLGEGALSNEELMSNLIIFFVAGHDTTANALSYAVYYLAKHQDIQEKARQEAMRLLGTEPVDVLPTVEQTKELQYINCIMKETLRMTPPVSAIFARAPEEDTDLNGVYIPKGTPVAVDIRNMHYNPKVWKDPYRFNPDRFAPGGEAESQEGMAWLPFSNGGRQCIGMNFSLAEQRVLLSMLLRKYSWTLPEDSIHKDGLITNSAGLIGPIDLRITFTKRY